MPCCSGFDLTAEREILISLIHPHGIYIIGGGLLLIAGAGLAIEWVFRLYVFPIGKIAEETGIMHGVNPGHRIHVEGSRDIKQLAVAINSSAAAFETLNRSVEERIAEARARIEEEKNIFRGPGRTARGGPGLQPGRTHHPLQRARPAAAGVFG